MRSCRCCGNWSNALNIIAYSIALWMAVFALVAILLLYFLPFMALSGLFVAVLCLRKHLRKRDQIACFIDLCECTCHVLDEPVCDCHLEPKDTCPDEERKAAGDPCGFCWATHQAFPRAKPGDIDFCGCACHEGEDSTF